MNCNPLISIIIPVYNAALYIERCFNSIISQSYNNYEIIVINDGSTDNSLKIINRYIELNKGIDIKLIDKTNSGVSDTRNKGIELAKGKWITFIDVDDYIDENFFNIEVDINEDLIIQKKRTFGLVTNIEEYPVGIYKGKRMLSFLNENMQNELFRAPWGKFFKQRIIQENNLKFNNKYKSGEDTLFVLEYLQFCKSIYCLSTSYYVYYYNSVFSNKYLKKYDECLSYIYDIYRAYNNTQINNRKYLSVIFTLNTGNIILRNNRDEIIAWFENKTVISVLCKIFFCLRLKTIVKYLLKYSISKITSLW
ncbi:glycosyltransferase [Bacteroides caecigallinarum]|uniref:glycosyltransferase family 2 protein n=1 Tax=Bacteroides caecigallinarum TaxID=1411144 RepID=UPI00195EE065|nr:glycosyltransferase [Bacteroides caecigallinarum]MBM6866846.1 glycosyltransferase [Bacteroides caecigallinarum]